MKIKKGDKVIVIAGSDKGKVGIVQKAFPKLNKVVVDGVNVHKRHHKPSQTIRKEPSSTSMRRFTFPTWPCTTIRPNGECGSVT